VPTIESYVAGSDCGLFQEAHNDSFIASLSTAVASYRYMWAFFAIKRLVLGDTSFYLRIYRLRTTSATELLTMQVTLFNGYLTCRTMYQLRMVQINIIEGYDLNITVKNTKKYVR
jgi:hypothetical protein